jgi:hypothetical protein
LTNNDLSDAGACHLANAISYNQTLLMLELGMNEISDKGANYFFYAVEKNKTINSIELYGNLVSEKLLISLKSKIDENGRNRRNNK